MARTKSRKNVQVKGRRHSSIPAFKKKGWYRSFGLKQNSKGHTPKPVLSRQSFHPEYILR